MSGRLAGRRAIVIGAAPGNLVAVIARLYRAEGAEVSVAGRPGVVAEVADVPLWLASNEARFVTGQTIHVSGGQTLRRNPRFAEASALFAETN
ncbi:SDR family oxidoreductase [Rhizorhabdus sp. FW153]|uniref:SDR family oxidoreductase n=1 Tax=Rhizorhabdus sp. FW153 TaxID=3400216 RepID=UPI003CF8A263